MNYHYIGHELNYDFWESKRALFEAFYGAFYDFIKSHGGEKDLESHNIKTREDFYNYADYYADGKDNCYAIGFAFHDYFLKARLDGSLDTEPEDTFIGYCHKNDLFTDFINFLISFFAYWRNDEGCTRFDPYNRCDDMWVSNWAILVDTSKLFYFNSDTVYHWQSFRVKYCLDHIPGCFLSELPKEGLPKIRVAGYQFLGWFKEDGETPAEETDNDVYAKFQRMDTYNYWEKEEKKIVKVPDPNWKRVDPA